ncbi:MAG: hypothetical protein QOI87_3556 [Bradyrhizobium sp.]|jgi:hypothetical protein|nr:hypothetical protein [Bradyrhizobium sp.]
MAITTGCPILHGVALDGAEDQIFHHQADDDYTLRSWLAS